MLNANELLKKGIAQVEAAGIKPGKINPVVKINNRAKGRFGLCTRKRNGIYNYEIELNVELLNVDEKKAMNTVVHEILHTCEGCMNHGPRWKSYANIMNKKFGYTISRCSSYESFGLEKPQGKYVLKCKNEKCGQEYHKQRMSNSVKNVGAYRCSKCSSGLDLFVNGVNQTTSTTTKKQTKSAASTATVEVPKRKAKYVIKCTKCEKEYTRQRASNVTKNINRYKCACGGKLVLV